MQKEESDKSKKGFENETKRKKQHETTSTYVNWCAHRHAMMMMRRRRRMMIWRTRKKGKRPNKNEWQLFDNVLFVGVAVIMFQFFCNIFSSVSCHLSSIPTTLHLFDSALLKKDISTVDSALLDSLPYCVLVVFTFKSTRAEYSYEWESRASLILFLWLSSCLVEEHHRKKDGDGTRK